MNGSGLQALQTYGMRPVANVSLPFPTRFVVELTDASAGAWTNSIYAFLIGDDICRIGSSKSPLGGRLRGWSRDVTARLGKMNVPEKMATSAVEAAQWRERLEQHGNGLVFARVGTVITTPIGKFPAYLDEESVLIGRHQPPMNNSKHR